MLKTLIAANLKRSEEVSCLLQAGRASSTCPAPLVSDEDEEDEKKTAIATKTWQHSTMATCQQLLCAMMPKQASETPMYPSIIAIKHKSTSVRSTPLVVFKED